MPPTPHPTAAPRPFHAGELRRHLDVHVLCETTLVLGRDVLRHSLLEFVALGTLGQMLDGLQKPGFSEGAHLAHTLKGEAASMGLASVARLASTIEQCLLDTQNDPTDAARQALHDSLLSAWHTSHELLYALGFMPAPHLPHSPRQVAAHLPQLPLFPLRLLQSHAPARSSTGPESSEPLLQLTYVSKQWPDVRVNLMDMLDTCARNNPPRGITGLLLVSGTHFCQVLEGPEDAVRALYARICEDPRHTHVLTLCEAHTTQRCIPDWSMAICEVKAVGTSHALSNALLNGRGASLEELVGPSAARGLLQSFCENSADMQQTHLLQK